MSFPLTQRSARDQKGVSFSPLIQLQEDNPKLKCQIPHVCAFNPSGTLVLGTKNC